MHNKVTWRELIAEEMKFQSETFDDLEYTTLTDDELDTRFYNSYGASQGVPFTLWTKERVYFPVVYDGSEWVESVPRNPCIEATQHVGGE